jgi:hypothetical protein
MKQTLLATSEIERTTSKVERVQQKPVFFASVFFLFFAEVLKTDSMNTKDLLQQKIPHTHCLSRVRSNSEYGTGKRGDGSMWGYVVRSGRDSNQGMHGAAQKASKPGETMAQNSFTKTNRFPFPTWTKRRSPFFGFFFPFFACFPPFSFFYFFLFLTYRTRSATTGGISKDGASARKISTLEHISA